MAIARGSITLVDINEVVVGSTPPSTKVANETIWLDTRVDPPMLKVWDGSKWKEANDYEIGGVNILPNSNFETSDNPNSGFQWSVTKGSTSVVEVVDVSTQNIGFKNALHCKNTSNLTSGIYYNIWPRNDQNLIGKTFMLSGMVKYTGVTQGSSSTSKLQLGKLIMTYTNASGGTVTSTIRPNPIVGTSEWVKFEIPIKLSSSYKYARGSIYFSLDSCVGEFWLTGVKLEEGQKVTPWTPSYVDNIVNTESKIANAKAEIKVETDRISQNVSNLTTRVSTTEDTVTGITTEVKEISDRQAGINTTIDSINASVSSLESAISGNFIENGDFNTNTNGWSKVNISITRNVYAATGKTWANMYTSTTAGERYGYTEMKAINGKNHKFSFKLAPYNTSSKFYRIRLQYFNSSTSEWITQKEFTGESEGTRIKPDIITYDLVAMSDKYRVWVGKLDTEKFDIYVTDFVFQCNHDVAKKSDIEILDNKITSTVSEYDEQLGTITSTITQLGDKIESKVDVNGVKSAIEQNPTSVKIGFNKINDNFKVDANGVYLKGSDGKEHLVLKNGRMYVRNLSGNDFGYVGRNNWLGTNIYGMCVNMDAQTSFSVGFNDGDIYNSKFVVCNSTISPTGGTSMSPGLHMFSDLYTHNYRLIGTQKITDINHPNGSNKGTLNIWTPTTFNGWNISTGNIYAQAISCTTLTQRNSLSTFSVDSDLDMYSSDVISIENIEQLEESEKYLTTSITPNTEWCGTANIINGVASIDLPLDVQYKDYTVQLTAIGRNTVYLMHKNDDNFIVESDNDCSFDFIVKFENIERTYARSLCEGTNKQALICPDEGKEKESVEIPLNLISGYEEIIPFWKLYKNDL